MLFQSARNSRLALPNGVPLPQGIPLPQGLPSLVGGRRKACACREEASTSTGVASDEDAVLAGVAQAETREDAAAQGQSAVTRGSNTVTQGQGQSTGLQGRWAKAPAQGGVFKGVSDSRQLLCLASLAGTVTLQS